MDADNNSQVPDGSWVLKPGVDPNSYSFAASKWSKPYNIYLGGTAVRPALVSFKGRLYLFYSSGTGVDNAIYDGHKWDPLLSDFIINMPTRQGVSAVAVNDSRLIVMAADTKTNQILLNWTDDGVNMHKEINLGYTAQSAPSLVSYGNKVVAVFKSSDGTALKMMECPDPINRIDAWTQPVLISTSSAYSNRSPMACLYTDRLFMVFTDQNQYNRFTQAIYNFASNSWEYFSEDAFHPIRENLQTDTVPGLATIHGQLVMVYGNQFRDQLWYAASINGKWSINAALPFNIKTEAPPALAHHQGKLYCVFANKDKATKWMDRQMHCTVFDPAS